MANKGKSVIPLLPMASLLALSVDQLIAYGKEAVDTGDKAKTFSSDHKASFKSLGKVVAALKKIFNKSSDNPLVSTLTFAEFFAVKTGGKVNNHAESIGKAFGFFVDNNLIQESDFDACASDWLEKASAIVTEVKGDLLHPASAQAADILKKREETGAGQLKAILKSLKGPKTVDAEQALEMLETIYESNLLETVIASVGATVKSLTDTVKLERAYFGLQIAQSLCGTPEQQDAWLRETERNTPKPKPEIIGEKTFLEWADRNYPDMDPAERDACSEEVKDFFKTMKRLPANAAELDRYAESEPAAQAA